MTGVPPGITPTGKVAYSFFDNGTCTSDANTTTDTVTLRRRRGAQNSSTQGPLGAGSLSFDAVYSGRASTTRSSRPAPVSPSRAAQASSSTNTIVFDRREQRRLDRQREDRSRRLRTTATVTGVPGITPTGKVAYSFSSTTAPAPVMPTPPPIHRDAPPPPAWCRTPPHPGAARCRELLLRRRLQRRCQLRGLPLAPPPVSPSRWHRRPRRRTRSSPRPPGTTPPGPRQREDRQPAPTLTPPR